MSFGDCVFDVSVMSECFVQQYTEILDVVFVKYFIVLYSEDTSVCEFFGE